MSSKYVTTRRFFWFTIMLAAYVAIGILCEADNDVLAYSARAIKHSYLISLVAAWATSLQRRISNKKVRHFLQHIAGSIAIWITLRSLKFYVFESALANRYLWYMYYIPQLLMAFFFYVVTAYIGKTENEPMPKGINAPLVVTFLLMAGMMTNEIHGLALYVDPETGAEGHRILYFVVVAWIMIEVLIGIYRIPKHRDEGIRFKNIVWPCVFIAIGCVYCILYILPLTEHYVRNFEYTITMCTLVILCIESLIQGGFIQGNKDYEWCFKNSTIRGQIFDTAGNKIYQSHMSRPLGEDDWFKLNQYGRIKPDRNTEMLLARIRGGYVVWEKDIHDINNIMDNLLETRENIKVATSALQDTLEEEIRHNKIKEQNRLYDKVSAGVGPKFEVLAMCIRFAQNASGEELKTLIRRIDILGVYAKRKSNLILLSEKKDADFNMELELCLKETFDNLTQAGIDAFFRVRLEETISYETAVEIYDLLELVLEASLDEVSYVFAIVSGADGKQLLTVSMNLSDEACEMALRQIQDKVDSGIYFEYEIDDGSLNVSFGIFAEGGTDL